MENSNNSQEEPGLRNTLKSDLKQGDFYRSVKKDLREFKEFYINPEQKKRLSQMNFIKRFFFFFWWILKSMLLKLTPARRIILVIGLLFFFSARLSISLGHEDNIIIDNRGGIGGLLILFVLMLELKDKLLAKDELEAGRKIQDALKPEMNPPVIGWSLWLFTKPANEVSGDLVDFININDERAGVLLADIAGKGLKAALLTTKLQATVRALAEDHDSVSLLSKVNKIFHRDSLRNIFASLIYVELIPDSGNLKFVNAGHLPPFLLKQTGIEEFEKGEPALGLMVDIEYKHHILELEHGEIFLAYSDGLTEARNHNGEFFGAEKFIKILKVTKHLSAKQLGEAIVSEVEHFSGDTKWNDDLSLMIIQRN